MLSGTRRKVGYGFNGTFFIEKSLFRCEAFDLLTNQLLVVEIVDFHGAAHFVHRLGGCLACARDSLLQNVVDFGNVFLKLTTTLTHGLKELVEHFVEEFLALHVAESAAPIVVFQLVEVLVFGPEVAEVVVGGESVEVGEYGVALDVARVVEIDVLGVGVHRAHLLPHFVGGVAEIDAVAERFRHFLLAVGAREATRREVFGQHDFRLHEHLAVGVVEAAHEFARHLDHWLLVFAHRHGGGLEERDVGGLRHGVAEEAERDVGLEVAHLDFGLHRGIALHAAHGDEVHQIGGELGQLGNVALDEERAFFGVEAGREPVECDIDDALAQLFGVVGVIGEGLHVGHEHKHFVVVASVLQFHAAAQRADVVAQMEFSGGAVSSENYFFHCRFLLFFHDLVAIEDMSFFLVYFHHQKVLFAEVAIEFVASTYEFSAVQLAVGKQLHDLVSANRDNDGTIVRLHAPTALQPVRGRAGDRIDLFRRVVAFENLAAIGALLAAIPDEENGHDKRHDERQQAVAQATSVFPLRIQSEGIPGSLARNRANERGRRLRSLRLRGRFLRGGRRRFGGGWDGGHSVFRRFLRNVRGGRLLGFCGSVGHVECERHSAARTHASHFILARSDGRVVAITAFGAFYFHAV